MHCYIDRFDCGGNTRLNPRTNQKYDFFMMENGLQAQPVVIVDYETAKVVQNTHKIMSVHFNNNMKYGLVGVVFKDTNMIRKVLDKLGSEEIK